ncbi:hypothetical protein [Jatrophihabitans sp.]|uniref:Zn-ribbon domain-containing OB-fold protein n=1 Tax=Jatrophihabitans sp. TaxID=1932789 RepID=UPI0030C6C04F|nr:putative nucleic-acid-binding protein containing a Zn-ribbon [Jatrophihabitans sp.]
MPNAIDELVSVSAQTGEVTLAGARCVNCGEVVFPAIQDCPLCVEPDVMEPVPVRGHGVLRDYVLAERGPEGFAVPYLQAWIALDDGPVIYSTLAVADPRTFSAERGSPMTMILEQFGTGDDAFQGWKFAADAAADV